VEVTELSTHLQGQLVAVNPAYDAAFDAFAPPSSTATPRGAGMGRGPGYQGRAGLAAHGLTRHVGFSGALAWPFLYPWPQRPQGLIEEAFAELGRRWVPILDVFAENGVSYGYEIHPGEDVFDGATFEMFLDAVGGHVAATINYDPSHFLLQQMDYLAFIDIYHERISSFHVKDAEFNPDGRQGVYSGYQPWMTAGRAVPVPGRRQVDFAGVFSKLTQYGYDGWAVLEWEDVLKCPEQGAREGAPFIEAHLIERAARAFDDFAGGERDEAGIRRMLGL
jgi:sugar phosphate isomerase/epimerase